MSATDAVQKLLQTAPAADLEKVSPWIHDDRLRMHVSTRRSTSLTCHYLTVLLFQNVKSFAEILKNNPDAKEAMLKKYPMPFATYTPTEEEKKQGEKPFILCRQNRVGDKHRSPWTRVLYPKPKGTTVNTAPKFEEDELLLTIEEKFNTVWEAYTNLYYGHDGISSVILNETEKGDLSGFFAVQKKCEEGSWNSMHFMSMEPPTAKTCTYRIISHVLMVLNPGINGKESTEVDLSSYMVKDTTKELKILPAFIMTSHIENIGTILEANEIDIRSSIERVHIPNTAEALDAIQKPPEAPKPVNPLMGMMMSSDILKKKKIGV
eukprot:scaffold2227_cov168-Amphora_coffeaeformis.AAC.5